MKWQNHPMNCRNGETFYKKAIKAGNLSACYFLASLYDEGGENLPADLEAAEKYYKMAIEAGDTSVNTELALLYEKRAGPLDIEKAILCNTQIAESSYWDDRREATQNLVKFYKNGWPGHTRDYTDNIKLIHWCMRDVQINGSSAESQETLSTYLLPATLRNKGQQSFSSEDSESEFSHVEKISLPSSLSDEEQQWDNAKSWLQPLAAKMEWKCQSYSLSGLVKNQRPEHKKEFYLNFTTLFQKAAKYLPLAVKESHYCFMTLKEEVQNHLIMQPMHFTTLGDVDCTQVGVRLYPHFSEKNEGKFLMAFENKNVLICDEAIKVLTGPYSLLSLIHYHKNNVQILNAFKHEALGTEIDGTSQELKSQVLIKILTKSERKETWVDEKPQLSFADFLTSKFRSTYGISEAKTQEAIERKINKQAIDPLLNQYIDNEVLHQVNFKIEKRQKKMELYEGILESFQERLSFNHQKKVRKFKNSYDFLSEMFD